MSLVSQLLQRLGVVRSAASMDTVAETPPPQGEPFEDPDFDPEETISSLHDPVAVEPTMVSRTTDATHPGTPRPAPKRSVTLSDLLAERGLRTIASVGDLGMDVDALLERPLDEAYEDAGLPPAKQGCSIEEIVQAIRSGRAAGLTPVQVRFKIEADVVAATCTLRDVAADAAAKDEVLDAFEAELREQVEARNDRLSQEAEALQRQILAMQAQREDLLARAAGERNRFANWVERKRAVERAWADALDVLAPFV